MKFLIYTLGCKVNQYETQAMETMLLENGHEISTQDVDAIIVNTCAVTAESSRKSRQAIRRLKSEHPNALVAVGGCHAQISPDEVSELGADIVFGSGNRTAFINALETAYNARKQQGSTVPSKEIDDPFKRRVFEVLPAGSVAGRTRAMLKIEDGCDNFCTYCVIPYARGRVRSLPPELAAEQAIELANEGYRELVITGIEISSYGKDLRTENGRLYLTDVIETIAKAVPDVRLRLGSLEPTIITEDFCSRLAALGNICPHFHLSLQSGCDKTLAAMHRKYDTAKFYEAVVLLKKHFENCALTADLITGFPGETEEDHQSTLQFIQKCGFSSMHIFPYSERPGTPAANMANSIPKSVRAQRAHDAQTVAAEMEAAYLQSCVGKKLSALYETESNGFSFGHTDNYCTVQVKGTGKRGLVENVEIIGISDKNLVGKSI